jgi:hypothetical protein
MLIQRNLYESFNLVLIECPSEPTDKPRELLNYGDGC